MRYYGRHAEETIDKVVITDNPDVCVGETKNRAPNRRHRGTFEASIVYTLT